MVKSTSRFFVFCLIFALSFNLYAFDFMANKYENKQSPDFVLQDLSGKYVSLKDYKDKPVILFFWTTWCPHCRSQIQVLNEEYGNMKSLGIELLAIDINEPKERIKEFVEKHSLIYPVLLDSYNLVASEYDVEGIPTFIFISKDRQIVSVSNNLPDNYKEIFSD